MQKYVLKLVVKKKWFDMIVSGEKTEEYREIKPYWIGKLVNQDADSGFIGYANEDLNINSEDFPFTVVGSDESLLLGATHFGEWVYPNGEKPQPKIFGEIEYIPFTHVLFFHGYSKNRKSIEKEIDSITIGKPQKGMCPDEWLDTDVFIIRFK